jgi:hypothetical protein
MVLGRPEPLARPLPRLLSLELFNPETDDVDSDSSGVSSPDSVSSVISVLTEEPSQTVASTDRTQQGTLGNGACPEVISTGMTQQGTLDNGTCPEGTTLR